MIAALPADGQDNARNEQFNILRLEAKLLLKDGHFDKKAPRAITEEALVDRRQRVILPRLSGIVLFGVILALVGLGVNSIILDDWLVNSMGCLVSTGGMLLIIMAAVVWAWSGRRRLSNYGELYLGCNGLLYEINHALNQVIPGLEERLAPEPANTPNLATLVMDSLTKQAADWQEKVRHLEAQQADLGPDAPLELRVNLDFARRELARVQQEYNRLHGYAEAVGPVAAEAADLVPALHRAKSVTMEMPAMPPEEDD
jgi:hypothetical protein